MALRTESGVTFHSNDREIQRGFERVKHQALHWVFEDCPVGDYYEAALPSREAFCMRDQSHQATGAEVLGLSRHNRNMFLKFARGISKTRDWCSFWEIDRWDRPCPVDYENDSDFWYNLPANFDVLHACWRMYLWTGNRDYLEDPDFDRFYALTTADYVAAWDHDGDGIPDTAGGDYGRRGIAGYDESRFARSRVVTATDTTAALARAYLSYAEMCALKGRKEQEEIYRRKGISMLDRLDRDFYTDSYAYAYGLDKNRQLVYDQADPDKKQEIYVSPSAGLLYWDTIRDLSRIPRLLDHYAEQMPGAHIEGLSHYPELQWRYGRDAEALVSLRRLMDPALPRKEYPEASFCTVGAVATGLMGIQPDARDNRVATRPGLAGITWAELNGVPVLNRLVSVLHEGGNSTTFTLDEGEALTWRCRFWGQGKIQGREAQTKSGIDEYTGKTYVYADIPLQPRESVTAVLIGPNR
jgi:hypothetical protein